MLISFLAALGVNTVWQTFYKPYSYTGYLSGLVKMGQMLVVKQAI
jgi:hypothetical protein